MKRTSTLRDRPDAHDWVVARIILALMLTVLPFGAKLAGAAGGDLDRSFGASAGYITYAPQIDANWLMTGAVALADGRAVIGGYLVQKYIVRRYFPDGRLDTTFGTNGSTEIPDFSGRMLGQTAGVSPGYDNPVPYLDGSGRIIIGGQIEFELQQRNVVVRRLDAAGQYDANYQPAPISIASFERGTYGTFLPMPDGRMAFVGPKDAAGITNSLISVHYFLEGGSPDTQRGDANGERVVGPATGRYEPADALLQADGKLLISARWVQPTKIGIVLLRLNADGSTDASFGNGGVAVIGEDMAGATEPTLAQSETGALAVAYWVWGGDLRPISQSYFVVHLLQRDGQVDAGQPMSGRIAVVLPNVTYTTGDPSHRRPKGLRVALAASTLSVYANDLYWQMDLRAGGSLPAVSTFNLYPFDYYSPPRLGGGFLWRVGLDQIRMRGRFFLGYFGGFTSAIAVDLLPNAQAIEIRESQQADGGASFHDVKANADGSLTVGGDSGKLFRFSSTGTLDTTFGELGLVSVGGDVYDFSLLDTFAGGATLLGLSPAGGIFYPTGIGYSLVGFGASGVREREVQLPDSAGYAALRLASGALWALRMGNSANPPSRTLQPMLYGTASAAGAVQTARGDIKSGSVGLSPSSDGGVLAAAAGGDAFFGPWVQLFRWRSDGSAASGSPMAATFIDEHYAYVDRTEVVSNPDGTAVVALALRGYAFAAQPAALFVLAKLRADGTLDANFGESGKIRFPRDVYQTGVLSGVVWQHLARQSDGKLLLAGYGPSGSGTAVVVGRYTADGQPDGTFGTGGNHEVRFTLANQELVHGMTQTVDGKIVLVGRSGSRGLIIRLHGESTPPPATPVAIVEFYNTPLGHYFITGGAGEIAAIEAGAAGPGWSRTGQTFKAYAPETGIAPGAQPVCRFYGTPGVGPNSHFYTVDSTECELVKHDPGWTYEGLSFYVPAPTNGACASGQVPVYRAYNMRFAQNDSNHRYTTDTATYAQMQAQGWAGEGVRFCGAQ